MTAAREAVRFAARGLSAVLIFAIRAYQSLHIAFFRGSCRFHPTCSQYALEAIDLHGPGRGTLLATWRVLRCQPFCRGGFDPVPEPKRKRPGLVGRRLDAPDPQGHPGAGPNLNDGSTTGFA